METRVPAMTDIPIGKMNAISRADLAGLWQMDDRHMRAAIAALRQKCKAREEPYRILSSSDQAGYWRSDDPAEIAAYNREIDSRITRLLLAKQPEDVGGRDICPTE